MVGSVSLDVLRSFRLLFAHDHNTPSIHPDDKSRWLEVYNNPKLQLKTNSTYIYTTHTTSLSLSAKGKKTAAGLFFIQPFNQPNMPGCFLLSYTSTSLKPRFVLSLRSKSSLLNLRVYVIIINGSYYYRWMYQLK